MLKSLSSQTCITHGKSIIALDLQPSTNLKDKYLCLKCITEKLPQSKWIELINDAETKYKQTKLNEFNSKKKLMQSQLDKLNKLHNKFKELQKQINSCINQSIKLINDKLEQAQSNFNKILEPNFDVFDEKDLIYLSNHQNKELNFTLELNEEKEVEFIDQVEQQVQKLQFEINLKEISKLLEMLLPSNLNKNEESESLVEKEGEQEVEKEVEEGEFHKTVALMYCCPKHKKEIIMVNLEPGKFESRLCCVICISESSSKLTDLIEANKIWQKYKQIGCETQKKREAKQKNIKDIFINYQKQNQLFQFELLELIQNHSNKIKQKIKVFEFESDNQSLLQLELKQIEEVIDLLSSKDKYYQQLKNDIDVEDQSYQNELIKKFSQIEQNQSDSLEQINKLFCMNLKQICNIEKLFSIKNQGLLKQIMQQIEMVQLESQFFDDLIPYLLAQHQEYQKEVWIDIRENAQKQLQELKNYEINKSQIEQKQNQVQKYSQIYKTLENSFRFQDELQDQCIQTQKQFKIQPIQGLNHQLERQNYLDTYNKWKYDLATNYQYGRGLYFHLQQKQEQVVLSSGQKIATTATNNYELICVCHTPIQEKGINNVFFKINQLSMLWIGICIFNVIPKNYFRTDDWRAGHGFYAMRNDGVTYSHHDQSKNAIYHGFSFSIGDVIKIEVNNYTNKITWSNLKKINHVSQILYLNSSYITVVFQGVLIRSKQQIFEFNILICFPQNQKLNYFLIPKFRQDNKNIKYRIFEYSTSLMLIKEN